MFSIFRPGSDLRLVDHGRVPCPVRGSDVEVDVCGACRWLVELGEASDVPFLRCRPEVVRIDPSRISI